MSLPAVFRFEVGHHLRQPSTWVYLAVLLAVTLLLVAGGANPVGTGSLFNAPVKIATFTLFIGLLATLVTAALFVESGHRDVRWRMEPLFYTAPVGKRGYLGGRFLGALLINALLLLAVPAGLLLGTWLPAVSAEALGPFRLETYLLPYLVFLLPNLLVNAAVLFGVAVLSRRSLPGYLGALGLIAAYLIGLNATGGIDGSWLAALVDPTGVVALTTVTEGWTRVELDTRAVGVGGVLLWNRLLWTALAGGLLAFTFHRFRREHATPRSRRRGRQADTARASMPGVAVHGVAVHGVAMPGATRHGIAVHGNDPALPSAPRSFDVRARLRQTLVVARISLRQIVWSREFLLVALGLAVFAVLLGTELINDPMFGLARWPLTAGVIAALTGSAIQILFALMTIFYAGELVWAERDAGIDRISDSVPVPDWIPFIGKLLALGLVLAGLQAVLMASGILAQAVQGYYAFESGLYLQVLFGLQLADYLLFAVLALLAHVLVDQKYLGHFVAMLLFVAMRSARRFGMEHNLLVYGSDPGWLYSDLAGFGASIEPFIWFKLYWGAWALLLAVAALLFWVRGTERGLRARMRLARQRFTPRTAAGIVAAAVLVLVTGGFIFYNTNVRNQYRTAWEADELHAEYERRYKRFEQVPQPWLTAIRLHAEVYPEQREVAVRASYGLVNRTEEAIDSVHLSSFPAPEVTLRGVRFDRPADPVLEDATHGYRIFVLRQPLPPGDSLQMDVQVQVARRGFRNRERPTANTAVVGDFTHLPGWLLLPAIGYQRDLMELSSAETRREHGLPSAGAYPSMDDPRARRVSRASPYGDWIRFEATVGTSRDQMAVLPGTLQRTWTQGDRRYFHFRADAPILNSFALLSAGYALHRSQWNDVEIRILHHPDHAFNLDHMVRNVGASLDYLSEQFGPYQYRQFTMVEFPRYGTFARAQPGQMLYTENHPITLGRLDDDEEITGADGPLLVTAHEIAHQWWGHQVMAADVRGSQTLSETLAQYSAAMVLKRASGPRAAHRFMRSMQLSYLNGRGSHRTPEVPLLFTTDHEYIHYRKGAVVIYALQDYIGEERVNSALRRLVRDHALQGPPYPTALDLYAELQAVTPDSLQYLLEDLFTTITLWDLRAMGARAERTGSGDYRVTLDVDATKVRSDSVGNDTEVRMDDLVEIGVFAEDGEPLYLGKHRVRSGRQSITVTASGRPARAGIDPYHTLITRDMDALIDDRIKVAEVRIDGPPAPERKEPAP